MAEFCRQCAGHHFGPDEEFVDFKGLSTEEDTRNGRFAVVLCEGCGPTLVDHTGRCVAVDCDAQHGEPNG